MRPRAVPATRPPQQRLRLRSSRPAWITAKHRRDGRGVAVTAEEVAELVEQLVRASRAEDSLPTGGFIVEGKAREPSLFGRGVAAVIAARADLAVEAGAGAEGHVDLQPNFWA